MFFSRFIVPVLAGAAALVSGAPVLPLEGRDAITDSFIVVMKDSVSDAGFSSWLKKLDKSVVAATQHTYSINGFKGFSGTFSSGLLNILTAIPEIAYIEPNFKVKASALTTQSNAPWGLGRISHRAKGSTDYVYDSSAGEGTWAYIIDTGIYTQHNEFQGRATFGANFAGDGQDTDGNGHGTHVAGTIGSRAYGVAKKTNLIAVKVLDATGSGSSAGVIAGIQWAANDAQSKGRIGKAVANLSLGGIFSQASNNAVAAAVRTGLFMAVAAGNDMAPAALYSPASEATACTVGATDKNDAIASYSNYGTVVDILAPGTAILSTWIGGADATNTISGTSMATPHVAGLGAYLLGLEGSATPAALCTRIKTLSTKSKLNLGLAAALLGTPNQLAYNGNGA